MNIIKTGSYYIPKKDISAKQLQRLHQSFSYYNPKTDETRLGWKIDKGYVVIPRNFNKLKSIFPEHKIIDKASFPKINKEVVLSKTFKLKPKQVIATTNVLKTLKKSEDNSTILKAAPGFGKSYTLPFVVSKIATNTLIIVDRTNLAIQMKTEFEANCASLDLTILGGKVKIPSSITIVTFQFLIKNEEFMSQHKDYFGLVVVDECHTIGSEVFTTVVGKFNAKYRIGLSATPTRSDFMTQLLLDVMGTKIVSGDSDDNLSVNIINMWHPSSLFFFHGDNYKKVYSEFLIRPGVYTGVVDFVEKFKVLGRFGLIYITEVSAQEFYEKELLKLKLRVGVINQKTSQADRLKFMQMMEEEKLDVLISGSILQKGISIKRLDYIINLSNLTKEGYEQLIGRLRRHHPTKKPPMFIDFLFDGKLFNKSLDRVSLSGVLQKGVGDTVVSTDFNKLLDKLNKQVGRVK